LLTAILGSADWEAIVEIRKLDIGCGNRKMPGFIGVDRIALPGVDVIHDLNSIPYPFRENTFDYIRIYHVVEHLESIIRTMEEIYRIARPGAVVDIETPHFSDVASWQDPTHNWHLSSRSFNIFGGDLEFSYCSTIRMVLEHCEVRLLKIFKYLGFEWLINLEKRHYRLRFLRRFWETYLCFIIRAKIINIRLRVIKTNAK
jgi:SAM-dependent methyltransferase